ncbi:hypothetical protein M7784_01355 [Desulfovibrio aminophilus]|nr:hypothetical protein [Desulfovibrio aminophilus]MCM0753897.1 hypothetical protein [Desulfovibrio aminophilus]
MNSRVTETYARDLGGRCGDCRNLAGGCCEAASEALRAAGWPGVAVRPPSWTSAGSCPGFEPTEDCLAELRESAEARAVSERAARARCFEPR